jgi:hypothetical protein
MGNNTTYDQECNNNWDSLLRVFHKIIESSINKRKAQYESLRDKAQNMSPLTPRQREGIIDRCDYQISLIDSPCLKPFANMFTKKASFQLDKAQSNGKE